MLADIDARQGKITEGEVRLREWVEQYREFGRRYLLVDYLYYKADQSEKAHAALSEASRYRFSGLGDGPSAAQFTGYDGSAVAGYGLMLASSEGWLDAALSICDRWDEHGGADVSYLAARSACLLANGDFAPASAQMDQLRHTLARRCDPAIGNVLHLPELQAAIAAKDRAYRYPTSSLLQRHRIRLLIDYE